MAETKDEWFTLLLMYLPSQIPALLLNGSLPLGKSLKPSEPQMPLMLNGQISY